MKTRPNPTRRFSLALVALLVGACAGSDAPNAPADPVPSSEAVIAASPETAAALGVAVWAVRSETPSLRIDGVSNEGARKVSIDWDLAVADSAAILTLTDDLDEVEVRAAMDRDARSAIDGFEVSYDGWDCGSCAYYAAMFWYYCSGAPWPPECPYWAVALQESCGGC